MLRPGDSVLDVGCGPGSITKGFRKYVGPKGRIVGIDLGQEVIENAKKLAGDAAHFEQGDIYSLKYADNEFDVVHAHQVLQHIRDPVAAIKEMMRVSNGLVTCREGDFESWLFHPKDATIQKWKDCYRNVCWKNNAEPDAGRKVKSWFLQAGFDPELIQVFPTTVSYTTPERAKFISTSWSNRIKDSALGKQIVDYGFATEKEVAEMSEAFLRWGEHPDAGLIYIDVAVIGRVSK